jgi:hypothetical protein
LIDLRGGEGVIKDKVHYRYHDRTAVRVNVEPDANQDHGDRHGGGTKQQALSTTNLLDEKDWCEREAETLSRASRCSNVCNNVTQANILL